MLMPRLGCCLKKLICYVTILSVMKNVAIFLLVNNIFLYLCHCIGSLGRMFPARLKGNRV